ncbi:MAG: PDDEXK nuclease domain-containing protein [Defluviitaleaceae bacterium]|nr:PDDEXK nuclease domain-containing protein [Defluviitaleaceae bacterium]
MNDDIYLPTAIDNAISEIGTSDTTVNGVKLFEYVTSIIETRKSRASNAANHETTMMFWDVGRIINAVVLDYKRASYGKKILSELSTELVAKYGRNFAERNIYRMMQFSKQFTEFEILSELTTKLSWTHFVEILPLKNHEARMYYVYDAAARGYGTIELRRQIARKAYERREIANANILDDKLVPFNVFKDPYLLDMYGLKDNFMEADLEKAILTDLEAFILEFGRGFSFVERQKRMIIDGDDIVLDLLFYNRIIKRLVAIELKLGKFKAEYMGQMMLYLKWLDRYERQPSEEAPIGIILCPSANRGKIELLEMDKAGIAVAEYWTHLPPKAEFAVKIREIMEQAKERLQRRKGIPKTDILREIDYFFESKDDDEEVSYAGK